uniref:RNA helicase n=1 Tax=Ananas comosus var. bracteatus TaxID=296719 RepID=A0A6V7PRT8_ANACO|nr:unnamed protein product [Ananas comosus var. bracteatus]
MAQLSMISLTRTYYEEKPSISGMSEQDVADYRKSLGFRVSGFDVSKPIKLFEDCGFSTALMNAISKQGYEKPTPIQCQALPIVLSGRDIIGIAKTGSGKTVAFVLPMIVHIMDQPEIEKEEGPIGMICAPTRELAHQIYLEARKFAKPYNLRVAAVYGGVSKHDQFKELKAGCEIVVATPGRLIDLLKMKALKMFRATYLVLDEADRMFDLGFEPQIRLSLAKSDRTDRHFFSLRPCPGSERVQGRGTAWDKDQASRMDTLQKFKSGIYHVLVATDVAARGLDIKSIKSVVNYDIAKDMDMHIHRIGRTGCAGDKDGTAYTLITQKEARFAGELVNSLIAAGQDVSVELMDLAMKDAKFRSKRDQRKGSGMCGGKGGGGGGSGRGVRGVDYGLGIGYKPEESNATSQPAPGRSAAVNSLRTGMMQQFKSNFVAAASSSQSNNRTPSGSAPSARPVLRGFVFGGTMVERRHIKHNRSLLLTLRPSLKEAQTKMGIRTLTD